MNKRIDSAATVDKNGNLSNARLHEQMTEGVDDSHFRAKTRARLLENGSAPSALNGLFSDLDPLPVDLTEERERVYRTKVRTAMHEEFGVSTKDLNRRFPDLPPLPED